MAHTLLAVDPGSHYAGVAFYVGGRLAELTCIRPQPLDKASTYDVVRHVSMWLRRCMHNVGDPDGKVSVLIQEGQQVYGGPRRQDPNDLLPLARVVGGIEIAVDAYERQIVLPRTWTGGVPKEVRQRRWLGSIGDHERAMIAAALNKLPKDYQHDAVDAAMLGAYAVGRLRVEPEGGYKQ